MLGVRPTSTREEIRRAFVTLAQLHHPDHVQSTDPRNRDRAVLTMRELNEAWRVLGDERRRREYDRHRRADHRRRRHHERGSDAQPTRDRAWARSTGPDPDEPFDRAAWGLDGEGAGAHDGVADDGVAAPLATALKVMPFVVVILFVVGIFVYSAYAPSGGGPAGGASVAVGSCVLTDGDAIGVVPCTSVNDGQVVEVEPAGGRCRDEDAELLASRGDGPTLCVVATLATRS